MDWNFSFGWMILGLMILAASGAVVANYQKISDNMLSGPSSYDRVKFWGMIGVGINRSCSNGESPYFNLDALR